MSTLNTRGAAAPGLAAPERATNDNARGEPGASRGQAQGLSQREFTAWPTALHPDFVLALSGLAGALLALLLRAGGRA
ncbi:MAG TPA: hypothetical protein PKJ45_08085 [Rubrivivax sp.]|nr:hypothetical protein [Rubrivivax sp.]